MKGSPSGQSANALARRGCVVMMGILLIAGVGGCRDGAPPEAASRTLDPAATTHTMTDEVDAQQLIAQLQSQGGQVRSAATAELFRRGPRVLEALEQSGARVMATLEPSRLDVVMTLIAGLDQTVDAEFRRDSFGLHLGPEVSPEQLALMGRRHGFRLPDGAVLRADAAPNAYVELTRDVPLEEVLEAVLSTEAGVRTVNLNYVER